jgi:hypothetical protein
LHFALLVKRGAEIVRTMALRQWDALDSKLLPCFPAPV